MIHHAIPWTALLALAFVAGGPSTTHAQSPSSRGEKFLLQATRHPMHYYLSLPPGYDADARQWPVFVCVVGANSTFQEQLQIFENARGQLPFLIVSPCVFSCTNAIEGPHREHYRTFYSEDEIRAAEHNRLDWDEAGLLAVLDDLKRHFHAEERVVMTGFSGGGLLTYRMLLAHPDRVKSAVPVCANYFGDAGPTAPPPLTSPQAATPVRILVGEYDRLLGGGRSRFGELPRWFIPAVVTVALAAGTLIWRTRRAGRVWLAVAVALAAVGATCLLKSKDVIDPQTRAAADRLRARGYTDMTVTVVPDMGHSPEPARVVDLWRKNF